MVVCIICFVFNDGYRQSKSHVSINLLTFLLEEQQDSLFTDLLQFGFNKKKSTVVCTSLLKETIEY